MGIAKVWRAGDSGERFLIADAGVHRKNWNIIGLYNAIVGIEALSNMLNQKDRIINQGHWIFERENDYDIVGNIFAIFCQGEMS